MKYFGYSIILQRFVYMFIHLSILLGLRIIIVLALLDHAQYTYIKVD